MLGLETGWFEIVQYNDKQADTIANLIEQKMLFRYPPPTIITYYQGNEFLGHIQKYVVSLYHKYLLHLGMENYLLKKPRPFHGKYYR